MYNNDTQILFPLSVILELTEIRGKAWKELVEKILEGEDTSVEKLSFSLMMIRLNKCIRCQADSYRAMRGCVRCSQGTIRRYGETDDDLVSLYEETKNEILRDPLLNSEVD